MPRADVKSSYHRFLSGGLTMVVLKKDIVK